MRVLQNVLSSLHFFRLRSTRCSCGRSHAWCQTPCMFHLQQLLPADAVMHAALSHLAGDASASRCCCCSSSGCCCCSSAAASSFGRLQACSAGQVQGRPPATLLAASTPVTPPPALTPYPPLSPSTQLTKHTLSQPTHLLASNTAGAATATSRFTDTHAKKIHVNTCV